MIAAKTGALTERMIREGYGNCIRAHTARNEPPTTKTPRRIVGSGAFFLWASRSTFFYSVVFSALTPRTATGRAAEPKRKWGAGATRFTRGEAAWGAGANPCHTLCRRQSIVCYACHHTRRTWHTVPYLSVL